MRVPAADIVGRIAGAHDPGMSDLRRPSLGDRVRDIVAAMAQQVQAPAHHRLAPAHAPVRSSRAATRGGWLLLSEGRPTLLVRRRR
jgi:hypothetical protein